MFPATGVDQCFHLGKVQIARFRLMKARMLRLLAALVATALLGGVLPSVAPAKSPPLCPGYINFGKFRERKFPDCISRKEYAQAQRTKQRSRPTLHIDIHYLADFSLPDIRVRQTTGVNFSTNKSVQTTHSGQQSSMGWLGYGTTSTQISIN